MIVLGLDTSTRATAVAVLDADDHTSEARDDPPAGAHPGHATRLLEMAREVLAGSGLGWSEVDRIAVGVGPGTFTGLRVGVATARGLAQSLSVELVGVSSLQALAVAPLEEHDAVLAVIDARRGEMFAAAYEKGEDGLPQELAAPRALAPSEITSVIAEAEQAAGATRQWLAVGDGALCFRSALEAAGARVAPLDCSLHLLSAAAVCELGARGAAASLHALVPDYRRRPDAELALARGGQRASA